jgi:RNA polymerase sigma-70 factor (ECF subfamily)
MAEWTLSEVERLTALSDADRTFQMTEEAFGIFYDLTARPLWIYLARTTGDRRVADDLLQETYYRFLRTTTRFQSDDHRRHYLFRIATNLAHDHRRRSRAATVGVEQAEWSGVFGTEDGDHVARKIDVTRALARLKPRERSLLWQAYALGASHEEIAAMVGVKRASLKALLHRARRRFIAALSGSRRGGRP